MRFEKAGFDSLIIYFADVISQKTAIKIKKAYQNLKTLKLDGIIEIVPSYTSIFITFDIFKYEYENLKKVLEQSINLDFKNQFEEKIINIDVYYGKDVGFDLERLSFSSKLSIEKIILLHSQKIYDVYAIGFLPGFAYLGILDENISFPRIKSPRKIVPKGSVAIADSQTAVYPKDSPGGWNIIGKTTFEFFNKNLENLSSVNVGDKIKFNPISKEEFLEHGGII